ncbi:hypothetical protein ACWD26_03190 [Streptomyces sp. NPDC002787]
MADAEDSGSGSTRRRSWAAVVSSEPVVTTVVLELAGLALAGVVALVGWPFGWLPDPGLVALLASMAAIGPVAELYHAGRPPRWRAVVVALLALATVTPLVSGATNWALPSPAHPGVGFLVGFLVAVPISVAVLARSLGRADTG